MCVPVCVCVCVRVCMCLSECLTEGCSPPRRFSGGLHLQQETLREEEMPPTGTESKLVCCAVRAEGSPASHNPLSSFLWDLGRERKWLKHWCSRCYEWHNLLDRALGNLLPSARNAQLISLRRIKEIILQTNSMLHTIEEAPIRRHGKGNQESREKQIRYRFINIWL